jgi:hypothetical protein
MKKTIFFIGFLFFFMAFIMSGADVRIDIMQPNSEAWLVKHSTAHIRWTYGTFYTSNPRNCQIFCGPHLIAESVPVTSGDFPWTVGRKNDGTFMDQASYEITIVCPAYSDTDGPEVLVVDSMPNITFTAPVEGDILIIGSPYTLRWTHSSFFDADFPESGMATIYCGDNDIASVDPVSDQLPWAVGRKKDGTFMAPGNYTIDVENIDYWSTDDSNFRHVTLVLLELPKVLYLEEIRKCPGCYRFDPLKNKFDFRKLPLINLELLFRGELLADLGKFGSRRITPSPVKIVLKENLSVAKARPRGFELRARALGGKILLKQDVQIEIVK